MRIALLPAQRRVVVAYVQSDSSFPEVSFDRTGTAAWADKQLWPRFDKARNR